jgi:hypothetical protein
MTSDDSLLFVVRKLRKKIRNSLIFTAKSRFIPTGEQSGKQLCVFQNQFRKLFAFNTDFDRYSG